MIRRKATIWAASVLALAIYACAPTGPLRAQESAKPASETQAEPDKAKGEHEVKEGEPADAIRHSPTVKWIARHTGLTDNQVYWVCIGLNFAVIFFAVGGFLRKKLPGYFGGRTATIQKGIEEARKTSEDARRRLADVEGRLSRLDTEIASMRREADENAKAEEQRILAAGEEERRRIVASAEQEIEMTANAARRELKAYVAELAVELAEKKVRVTRETDEALVRAFTSQMGKDGN
ncbi:MAG TPA: ATP synthase F0 subunit B [Candidatus Angelobacter sp.]|nr:ATP synthase F0 subunit B [Candidatus Angelobacter sp.]